MKKKHATLLFAIVGVGVFVGVVCVSVVAWFFISVFDKGGAQQRRLPAQYASRDRLES